MQKLDSKDKKLRCNGLDLREKGRTLHQSNPYSEIYKIFLNLEKKNLKDVNM